MMTSEDYEREQKRQLGKISSVHFGFEDHGILSLCVFFEFGGSSQGMGHLILSKYDKVKERQLGTAGGLDLVIQLLLLFKVDTLNQIKGRTAYALRDDGSWSSPIRGIEIPAHDGGGKLLLSDWASEWFPATKKSELSEQ